MALGGPIFMNLSTNSLVGQRMPNDEYAGTDGRIYNANEFLQTLVIYRHYVQQQLIINQRGYFGSFWKFTCSYREKQQYLNELINALFHENNNENVLNLIHQGLEKFSGEIYGFFNSTLTTILLTHGDRLEQAGEAEPTALAGLFAA
jgi:hypothetical protein